MGCPKSMIGRVIGRNGETIKALQTFTGTLIQVDQTSDPPKIAISGTPQSLDLALSMVHDIVRGNFKGFALLRQATGHSSRGSQPLAAKPVYAPGYGLIPPSQLYGSEGGMLMAAGAGGLLAPSAGSLPVGGGPQASPGYPQQLVGPGPGQYVLGMQPVAVAGPGPSNPGGAVYGPVLGASPGYSGLIYYSPADFTTAGAGAPLMTQVAAAPAGPGMSGAGSTELYLVPEGTRLVGTAAGPAGGGVVTGSRLFQPVTAAAVGGAGRGGAGGGAAGELLGPVTFAPTSAAGGGAAAAAGGGGGQERNIGSVSMGMGMAMGMAAGGGGVGGGGMVAQGLLPPNSLVMDAEGALYTYNPEA